MQQSYFFVTFFQLKYGFGKYSFGKYGFGKYGFGKYGFRIYGVCKQFCICGCVNIEKVMIERPDAF